MGQSFVTLDASLGNEFRGEFLRPWRREGGEICRQCGCHAPPMGFAERGRLRRARQRRDTEQRSLLRIRPWLSPERRPPSAWRGVGVRSALVLVFLGAHLYALRSSGCLSASGLDSFLCANRSEKPLPYACRRLEARGIGTGGLSRGHLGRPQSLRQHFLRRWHGRLRTV